MACDLDLDTEALRQAGARLGGLADAFSTANVRAREMRALIGHDALADQVGEFAIGWDDIRVGMVKDVGFLGEACERVGVTFEELDTVFAVHLRGLV